MFCLRRCFVVAVVLAAGSAKRGRAADAEADGRRGSPRKVCELAEPSEPQVAPDYSAIMDETYTLQLEMTDAVKKVTYYIHETHEGRAVHGAEMDLSSVRVTNNATDHVIYYNSDTGDFVEYRDGACSEVGKVPTFAPWGWLDTNSEHGLSHYGPSTILKLQHYLKHVYNTTEGPTDINDVMCMGWKACGDGDQVEIFYYYSVPTWNMPDALFFPGNETGFPVSFSTRKMDDTEHHEYSIVQFVPYVIRHAELETPRGADCEGLVGEANSVPVPSMPPHFSFRQEAVMNPVVDGYMRGTQLMDKSSVHYSRNLSLIRFDFTPAFREETPFYTLHPLKVVSDYNTGVQYFIDEKRGNCTRTRITHDTFNNHHHGIFGSGQMVSPDEFMLLTGKWAYLGPFTDRHLMDHRWTSTRHDLVDPTNGTVWKKVVLEWDFLYIEPLEKADFSPNVPVRMNVFLYDQNDPSKVAQTFTSNIADYSVASMYSVTEFDVFQCYESSDYEWSYGLFFFPTDAKQVAAASALPDMVRHQVFDILLTHGHVSPVRVSAIDMSYGLPGITANQSDTEVMLASVRLLQRAPYIYSYDQSTAEPTQPGDKEKMYSNINNAYECAEFCSSNTEFECKSFQVCDSKDCYLSRYEGQDGEPVTGVTSCEHWILTLGNTSFVDPPTTEAVTSIRRAVHGGEVTLELDHDGSRVIIAATELFHYRSPDPAVVVTDQFFLGARHAELAYPDDVLEEISTLEECEEACVSMQKYRCESLSFARDAVKCLLSSRHYDDMSSSDIVPMSHAAVMSRSYLTEYRPVFGGVSLNSPGPVYDEVGRLDTCARLCSKEKSIECRSFDLCFTENKCRLHSEGYVDGSVSGNYSVLTDCSHWTRASKSDFTEYSGQSLPADQHRIVLTGTTTSTCAQQCVDDTSEVCESFDFCETCGEGDAPTCGEEGVGKTNVCFLSTKHLGEEGVALMTAVNCQHYDREYFGELSYSDWKYQQQHAGDKPYGPGDMAGLAVGMMVMGVLLTGGFLYWNQHIRGKRSSGIPMSFAILRGKAAADGHK